MHAPAQEPQHASSAVRGSASSVPAEDHPPVRPAIIWGVAVGIIQVASPLGFWWLDAAVVYAVGLAVIAAIYVGFAVADGRWRVIAVEAVVAMGFIVLGTAGITGPAWLLVAGFFAHGVKDAWQHRTRFVSGTRWWPPFCAAIDFVVALAIAVEIVAGLQLRP